MDSDQSFSSISERSESEAENQDLELLEEARRIEVLKNLNLDFDESDERNEEVMEVLQKKNKREEKKAKLDEEKDLKKMRARNAQKFFVKMKVLVMKNFKQSILEAKKAERHCKQQIFKMLSYLTKETIQEFYKLKKQKNMKIKDFIQFLERLFSLNNLQLEGQIKYRICWSLAMHFGFGICKLCFVDLSHIELQSYYNLKYKQTKKTKKKISKEIDIFRNKIKRKIAEEEISKQTSNIIPISAYSFNSNPDQSQSLVTMSTFASRNQNLIKLKQTFKDSFFKIFCPITSEWVIFNAQTLEIVQLEELKEKILEGLAVVGFYGVRILKFLPEFSFLEKQRRFGNIEFRDFTPQFSDKYENVLKRRLRIGFKWLYKSIIKQGNFYKTLEIFTDDEKMLIQSFNQIQQKQARNYFPTSSKSMKTSEYYVVPSLIEKYKILKEDAKPIPNLEFHEEKVYRKRDLIRVASKMGWIDLWRMVKEDEEPIKITETRAKKQTKLYKFSQTQPFKLKIDSETREFVLDDQYNSIYVPPNFVPPEGIIKVEQNIDYICKKHKYKHARLVQGFNLASFHIVPNNIGYLVYEEDKEEIMKIYEERQQKLRLKKESRKDEQTIGLWKKLFKSILITQQIG